MLKYVLALLFLFTSPAFADIDHKNLTDFDNLTSTQKAEVVSQIAKLKAKSEPSAVPAVPTPPVSEKVNAWVEIGASLGKGLAATAKELGVAVNDFAKSPVGILTTAVIIWKYVGHDLFHVTFGVGFFIVYFSVWFYLVRKWGIIETIKYTETPAEGIIKKTSVVKTVSYQKWKDMEDSFVVCSFLSGIIGIVIGVFITFS
jgi:hypothetical protein